jgi:enoyl-CoA hydratase/carnithine racemase
MTNLASVADVPIAEAILLREDHDGVATLTLNRPSARNALSVELMAALQRGLDKLGQDRTVSVVVLEARGPAFCSGHDLKELRSLSGAEAFRPVMTQCSKMMSSIVRLPQPVIARVHATATAAGCQLVASCDLAIAADSASFATPGVNIGLFCSTPMVAISRCIGSKHAMQMLLTGDPIDAKTAWRFGLVNEVVAADKLDETVATYARTIAAKPARVMTIGKEAFYHQRELDLDSAYEFVGEVMTRNRLMAESQEGIDAFIEKRSPHWPTPS